MAFGSTRISSVAGTASRVCVLRLPAALAYQRLVLRTALSAGGPPVPSTSSSSSSSSLTDHLVLTIDGFVAQKAAVAYPGLVRARLEPHVARNIAVIQSLVPARIQGQLLSFHPQLLLETDMHSWLEFLTSFGFQEGQVADVLRSTPEVFYKSTIFQAGQLLLFLRQNLQLDDELVIRQCFKWAASLQPDTTQESMAAVASCLQQDFQLRPEQLPTVLQAYPDVLGWNVEADILPKLSFFHSLGPTGQRVLDTMYDKETGWLQGLRSWHYSVAPKLQLLSDVLGSKSAAHDLLARCPEVLKMPVEAKLQPLLTALASTAGLTGGQVAQLLQECPVVLGQPREEVVSRINFLIDVIGGSSEDLMQYPGYMLLSLSDMIGPRYYFLARQGLVDAFSDASTGSLQLQRVLQSELRPFLADVAQTSGSDPVSVTSKYDELKVEWDNLLGWCADKAFSSLDGQISSVYEDQLNLFYVLVQ